MRLHHRYLAVLGLVLFIAVSSAGQSANAQDLKQLQLSDAQVTSFIAAQTDFAPLVVKLSEAGEELDEALRGELDGVAKKHGFESFEQYMDVNDNIAFVMGGLNAKTMEFTEPVERLKADLEEIKADGEIPEDEKKLAVEDLGLEISATPLLQFKENVEVVKRHFEELAKLLPNEESGESLDEGDQ